MPNITDLQSVAFNHSATYLVEKLKLNALANKFASNLQEEIA